MTNSAKKRNFTKSLVGGGWILAIFGLISKAIGAFYRIPLTNILGAEGLGAYQMAYPVYALAVACSSTAISVLVARTLPGIDDHNVKNAFFTAGLKYALSVGVLFGVLMSLLARPLASLQGSNVAEYGYYVLSPSVFFTAVLSAFRGWFNSRLETLTTSISGLIEQIVKVFGVIGAYYLSYKGVVFALSAALLGVTISEAVATTFALVIYLLKGGRFNKSLYKIPVKAVFWGIVPLSIGSLTFPLATFADSLMTVKLLMLSGVEQSVAVSEYGILSGSVAVMVSLPISLAISFAVTALPVIANSKRRRDIRGIKQGQIDSFKAVLSIVIPSTVGLFIIAEPLINVVYGGLTPSQKELAITLLRLSAIQIPLSAVLQLLSAYLQALDKTITASVNMLIGVTIKLIANFSVLLLGVSGVVFSSILCFSVCLSLDLYTLKRLTGSLKRNSWIAPSLASIFMGAAIIPLIVFIKIDIVATALSVLLGGAVYGIMLLSLRTFDQFAVRKREVDNDYRSRIGIQSR